MVVASVLSLLDIFGLLGREAVGMYVPLSINHAFNFIVLGLTTRFIIERWGVTKIVVIASSILTIIVTFFFYHQYYLGEKILPVNSLAFARYIMPVLIFLLLFSARNILAKSKLLIIIGRYSLQIYLLHIFAINLFKIVILKFAQPSVLWGMIILVLAVVTSLGLTLIVDKIPALRWILFSIEKKIKN